MYQMYYIEIFYVRRRKSHDNLNPRAKRVSLLGRYDLTTAKDPQRSYRWHHLY